MPHAFRHGTERSFALIFTITLSLAVLAQARLVLNNNAWVRIDNGAWVVIGNAATTGIQTLGTGGNIRSEGEFNRVRWNIRNSTGTYVVPFTTGGGVKMPLTCTVTTAGDNGTNASISFSTYNYGALGPTNWNNNLYRPSDVTHMNNLGTSLNNSDNVVDRFWIIDPGATGYAYVTRPGVNLGFVYDPGAATGEVRPGNAITSVTPVAAQRFNSGTNQWGDMPAQGTFAAGATNSVTNVVVPSAVLFRSWALSDLANPLPVELVRFAGACTGSTVELRWATGSENGNSHFLIQHSADGVEFQDIGRVEGAGTSHTLTEYAFDAPRTEGLGYYRLLQVDLDGTTTPSPIEAVSCVVSGSTELVTAFEQSEDIVVVIHAATDQERSLELIDVNGKRIWSNRLGFAAGSNTVRIPSAGLAMGVYLIRSEGPEKVLVRRIVVN